MAVSYNKLWKPLVDKKMSKADLRRVAELAPNTMTAAETDALWQEVSHRVQVNMETLSQQQGDRAGSMIQELKEANRERYNYADFLRRFAVLGETMQVNDNEFDYIFYTYGLKL